MYEKFKRSEWFRHDRFGMFIHFGLYSIPARGEWVRGAENLSDELYYSYFNQFNPYAFDAHEWARAAKRAGMKYVVLTAKHHDGFCLFDSKLTDFKITNTPFKRDLIAEYVEALRDEGLKVGIYYSLIDWNHPAYPAYMHHAHPHRTDEAYKIRRPFEEYLEYMHGQIRELCSNYGKIDIMWFDYSYEEMIGEKWRATELIKMVRDLQPELITDNRLEVSGLGFGSLATATPAYYSGDFVSPECIIPPKGIVNELGEPIPWEACITMNDHWGYCAKDFNFKQADIVIKKLIECVSKGGNMLLNVGPDATGRFPKESCEILEKIGEWMSRSGEAIYGAGISEFDKPEWGRYTQNGDSVYACITETPIGPLPLFGIPHDRIEYVRLLKDGSEVKTLSDWRTENYPGLTFVEFPNYKMLDDVCTVLKIKLK
ncbi:MAG: alpha-L-fucosidase [Firmicutes bacterium]|nr:alpha-L-fucosidase [Bacillota bacterium]